MTRSQVCSRPGDGIKRWILGASVKLHNIDQCPRCRGTDKTSEVYEGFGIAKFFCERCDKEWWS